MDKREPTLIYGLAKSPINLMLGRILDTVDVLEIRDIDGGFRAMIVIMGARFEAEANTPKAALNNALTQAECSMRVNRDLVESTLKWLQSQ